MNIMHVSFILESAKGGIPSALRNVVAATSAAGILNCVSGGINKDLYHTLGKDGLYGASKGFVPFTRYSPISISKKFDLWIENNVSSYDVVHLHGLFNFFTVSAARHCHKQGVPYVVSPHGMLNSYGMSRNKIRKKFWYGLFDKNVLARSQRIHVCSELEQVELKVITGSTNIEVIPLPIPVKDKRQKSVHEKASKKLRIQDKSNCKFLFVGRLDPVKNLEYLITSVAKLRDLSYRLTIAGDGSVMYRNHLLSVADNLGISQNVEILGHQDDVEALYRSNDILVMPSISESFGLVAVEAALAGMRVVAADNVGVGKALEKLKAARLFNLASDALSDVLLQEAKMLTYKDDFDRNVDELEQYFSPLRIGNLYLTMYDNIVNKNF